ncbi:carbamoyl-phosphate synthase large subunit [Candidatus Lucifugimonas marina]|uniref:Carbamoyl phosphate synthase large chain n=1 Tax=Candidatus Lucifugimonas marina TaxID=3038979 RepID=A0AAJ5ZLE8_9CHLR|nr:carbamoyl-phosphate synthase large subunit [SAR202 cluster bacterium JH702]MDG0870476.1 carbamoyl-phosphate synthase large subunit [SAR202 cluster bacterium JH639]WFG36848.1 carbamoyl-phosphate synthase large subunit [SAR202 cluster bacterium JH545]WFG40787.1 carbamoyl-phosphate synthase large subunit [SAR202 cluster bacterium JH1073]
MSQETSTSEDIKKVLVIGSGPIIIGQAAEFDYAGTQACRSLREEGVEVVLVNSNPATIMTDEDMADRIYIEPLTVSVLERILDRERPDGVIGTMGGQTGLNLVVDLEKAGILEKYNVKALGTSVASVEMAEDREQFRDLLSRIGEPVLPSYAVETVEDAVEAGRKIGYPAVVRPAYTLGGTGGGIAQNEDELRKIATGGIAASKVGQVLVEQSLLGWKEVEYEVMRDGDGNVITICNMENLDPMGVHTGDSIVVAPSQTLNDKDYQRLRTASLNIISGLNIKGGCNVQLAYRPSTMVAETVGEGAEYDAEGSMYYVIEVNPRVSRSSALASKATGYPIARVAAKIALGKTLDQISNAVTQKTTAAFEPALDYCVVKIPRWPFDKFPMGDRSLGTQMKATGEVMAIDRTFEAALQKAVRSLENGRGTLLWEDPEWGNDGPPDLLADDDRIWKLTAAIRGGRTAESVTLETGVDPWFTRALQRIVNMERTLLAEELTPDLMWRAKRLGFSDAQIGTLADYLPEQVRTMRKDWGLKPVYKMVDTCAGEFEAVTPYFYSSYEQENEAVATEKETAIVLGSGPIRIGQGIEFDYCSVHAAWALQKSGVESVMINSNPETVSTDFDTSDRLYFEPLDEESVRDIIENEGAGKASGNPSSMVQFGGQTAINLSQALGVADLPVLGSTPDVIDLASDRGRFEEVTSRHGLPQPPGGMASDVESALQVAGNVGYPVLVRPSYVLGGRAMEIVQTPAELLRYFEQAMKDFPGQTILIDHYLTGLEVEVDAVCDGEDVLIPGIMQHIERAGVHSGDSMAVYPAQSLTEAEVETIVDYTRRIGLALGVVGLMNIQFVVAGGGTYRGFNASGAGSKSGEPEIYIIEVNPRSSRTIPFISKVTRIPMVRIATDVMRGKTIAEQGYEGGLAKKQDLIAVKAPVFSMSKLDGVDTFLGPEMKSTGEVMGIDTTFEGAVTKALLGSGLNVPEGEAVLLSIADPDKADALGLVRTLDAAGHRIYATGGTAEMIRAMGVDVVEVEKRLQGGSGRTVVDIIEDGTVSAVVNTVTGDRSTMQDGFHIRRSAVMQRIPCFTSIDTARCAVESEGTIAEAAGGQSYNIKTLAEYLDGE